MTSEERYIRKRLREARRQAREFYYCRKYPIQENKIVFTTIEGTTGFSCNPKYIALELLRRNLGLDLIWLVDDMTKKFPKGIRKVKNTLKNRAYELSTAKIWIDNSRKQLEVRKRPGQFYLQTWHANISPKPIGLFRGKSFSKIAYIVSKHDSDMIDLLLTNSKWMEETLAGKGILYDGAMARTGAPRNDILINDRTVYRERLRGKYGISNDTRLMMYAPTFRGGSQGTKRGIDKSNRFPDFEALKKALEEKTSENWKILLRLHPQLTARHVISGIASDDVIDVSGEADMFETLAACDALLTDYSATMFDASYMRVPVFIFAYDLDEYIAERGHLMWDDIHDLPFQVAETDEELLSIIKNFDEEDFRERLETFFKSVELKEDGHAAERAANIIEERLK